jgi:hypothetical protein
VGGNSAVVSTAPADKLDLLLVIDNSLSMGDEQAVLAAAVPQLLQNLTNPDCVSTDGATTVVVATPSAECPAGMHRQFAPLEDIHIGVITSSLGDFGGDACPETTTEDLSQGFADQNDHGWLLGALPRVQAKGKVTSPFLSWTAADAGSYASAIATKTEAFRNFVTAGGELGCGFEMTLESWYRFLVDPKPPTDVIRNGNFPSQRDGLDSAILAQRAAFLRSDSLVAVVMLSDENDCSLKDTGAYSWWPASAHKSSSPIVYNRMFRPSAACSSAGPNDRCCYSCMLGGIDATIPQDCLDADPTCRYTADPTMGLELAESADPINLRCMQQKQRFGYDFLFPVTRYSNALSLKTICPDQTYGDLDCDCAAAKAKGLACVAGAAVENPLYAKLGSAVPTGPDRDDPSRVFFLGIVGVPWQDLATSASLAAAVPLAYKPASELNWDLFAPIDEYAKAPLDPLMIEQSAPRTGTHPITGEALVAPSGAAFMANSINGHEWFPVANSDLQFACVFSLKQQLTVDAADATRLCEQATECPSTLDAEALRECQRRFYSCACSAATTPSDRMSPLCQQPDGSYATTQVAAKAYPGVRELQALRAFHTRNNTDNAIVASICPKDLTYANRTSRGYGYNPAVAALANRMSRLLEK